MDAVAECEQNTKQMGMRESSSAWRLYFRKEYFVPWHNAKNDEISTELVYHQVMRGISVGEYKCDKVISNNKITNFAYLGETFATSRAGPAYPCGAHEFTPGF